MKPGPLASLGGGGLTSHPVHHLLRGPLTHRLHFSRVFNPLYVSFLTQTTEWKRHAEVKRTSVAEEEPVRRSPTHRLTDRLHRKFTDQRHTWRRYRVTSVVATPLPPPPITSEYGDAAFLDGGNGGIL